MQWNDIDFEDRLGKEAAKTLVALDYYMKSCNTIETGQTNLENSIVLQ